MINIFSIKKTISRITPRLGATTEIVTNNFWTNAGNCGTPTPGVCSTPTFGLFRTSTVVTDGTKCGKSCELKETCTYFTTLNSCAPGGLYEETTCI